MMSGLHELLECSRNFQTVAFITISKWYKKTRMALLPVQKWEKKKMNFAYKRENKTIRCITATWTSQKIENLIKNIPQTLTMYHIDIFHHQEDAWDHTSSTQKNT